jgi:hypothetical protein
MNESAGVTKSGRTRSGNSNLKRVLGVAAMSVSRSTDTYLSTYYRRVASRRGSQRALVSVMHKLAIAICWHVLHDKTDYRDLGAEYFTRRDPERAMRRMTKEANRLGLSIRFEPIQAA